MKSKFSRTFSKLTIWLIIIYKLIFLFTFVLTTENGLNNSLLKSIESSNSSKSIPFTSSRSLSLNNLFKRIKRENNQLLINNELTSGLNSHDSFQPIVWTQELNNAKLSDDERHLSSDIELPEYSEEEDDDLEEGGNQNSEKDPEKDADYEEEELEGEKQRKKNKKLNKNRNSKKIFKNGNIEPGTKVDNDAQPATLNNNSTTLPAPNNTTPIIKPTKDYSTNYIELISGPGNLTKKAGEKIVLRCLFEAKPKPKTIKWFKNEAPLDKSIRNKYQIKEKRLSNNKWSTRLIISQLDTHDTAFYKCRATNNQSEKAEGVGILKIRSSDSDDNNRNSGNGLDLIGGYSGDSLNNGLDNTIISGGSDSTFHMSQQDTGSDMDRLPFFQDYPRFQDSNILDSDQNSQLHNTHSLDSLTNSHSSQCVPYKGTVCSQYLRNHTVIVQRQSQYQLEELLNRAFRIIANAANISPQCHRFTMPLLCFQSFHVCEQIDFASTFSDQYSSSSMSSANNLLNRMQQDHPLAYSSHYTASTKQPYSLKQLCRDECEILEHDICSIEFTLAKINPVAGVKSLLPNCEKLPTVGSSQHENCLRIGVTQDFYTPLTNHRCYLDKGETYRGNMNTTVSGKTCEIWSTISKPNSNHPELSGSHNFCRNPKGIMSGPWCNVKNENQQYYKELCDVPKCDDHFWIYYILTPLLAILTLSIFIGSFYCARNCHQQRKPSMDGICLSTNEIFAQQLQQQHLLQSNSLSNSTAATPLRMTLPFNYDRQANLNQQQNSISTASSKQSNHSLLSNVLNSVTNPGRTIGNAIGQSIKNTNSANNKLDTNAQNNLELRALLSNNESTNTTSHYALSNMFSINNGINIIGNPIANNLIHYSLNCVRILARIYPRLDNNSLSTNNYHSNSGDDAPSTHLKSSLNYQFYSGQLSISNQNSATQSVIIRALKLTTDAQNVTLFAEQAAQLATLNHDNVVKMLGVAIGSNNHSTIPQHFVIFEQFSPVNLINFLQQQPLPNKLANNNSSTFNPQINSYLVEYIDLLQFAYQIANGMQYLSDYGYVHGDLACRNCYINNSLPSSGNSRYHLKIGGLHLQNLNGNSNSRWLTKDNMNNMNNKKTFKNQDLKEEIIEEEIDDQDYYTLNVRRRAFPVRWLPPEVLLSHEYSTASDIWMFGVTCWEIMNFGRQIPFQSHNNAQVVDLIVAGRLLECPIYSDAQFYALMLDCWREVPNLRASFEELLQKLTQQINNLTNNSSHNNWLNNSIRNNNRISSPMPSQNRLINNTNSNNKPHEEDKVNGWLLNSTTEFNNSTANYLSNNSLMKNGQTALQKTNTMNSSSTYASSYNCNNQTNQSNNYNTNHQQAEYDQPFVQLNDLESNHKLKQPSLTTFQQQPAKSRLTVGLKHLELKNNLLNYNNSSLEKTKTEDYYENHYSKLSYENEETESMLSSNFGLI